MPRGSAFLSLGASRAEQREGDKFFDLEGLDQAAEIVKFSIRMCCYRSHCEDFGCLRRLNLLEVKEGYPVGAMPRGSTFWSLGASRAEEREGDKFFDLEGLDQAAEIVKFSIRMCCYRSHCEDFGCLRHLNLLEVKEGYPVGAMPRGSTFWSLGASRAEQREGDKFFILGRVSLDVLLSESL
ncbi:hypothetical protein ACLOJK_006631 [Asimina triloba]